MLQRIKIFLLILPLPFLIQCERIDPDDPLVFGAIQKNLLVQTIDEIVQYEETDSHSNSPYYSGTLDFNIDIDLNDTVDLCITNDYNIGKWGQKSDNYIKIRNSEFEVSICHTEDTLFSCSYSDLDTDPDLPYYETTYYTSNWGYNCYHTNRIHSTSTGEYPVFYKEEDSQIDNSEWTSDTCICISHYKSESSTSLLIEGEKTTNYKIRKGLDPRLNNYYIHIRKKADSEYLYGWVKVRYYKGKFLQIDETAIQIQQ